MSAWVVQAWLFVLREKILKKDQLLKLRKFLSGDCDVHEANEVIKWINSAEAEEVLGDHLREFRELEGTMFPSEEVFYRIQQGIRREELIQKLEASLNVRRQASMKSLKGYKEKKIRNFIRIAASISLIIISFFVGQYFNDVEEKIYSEVHERTLLTESTGNGQKLSFYLNDGTMVKLNSGSSLQFPAEYSDSIREVWLQGEAFFEVAENPRKPFIVRTNKISTVALGTSFTVRAVEADKHEVFLLSGKVNVALNTVPSVNQVLLPGEKALYEVGNPTLIKDEYDRELETSWKDGTLVFQKTPFVEVIKKIEAWYGVRVIVSGPVPEDLYISSKFQDDYLKEVLISLGYSWGFEFEIQEESNTVSIKFDTK